MCRSLGPKPIAVFRERSVPAPLQRLHHRLLYEPIQHRWNAQFAHPAVRLRDLHPFYRLWSVGSAEELFSDGWPLLASRTFCSAFRQLRFGPSLEGHRGCTLTLLREGQTVLAFLPLVGC